MRNVSIGLVLVVFSVNVFSQTSDSSKTVAANLKRPTQAGSIMVGGYLNANLSSNFQQIGSNLAQAGDRLNDYGFYGNLGFFTAPFLAFGGILYLNYSELRQSTNLFTKTSFGLGAFARPYFYITNQFPLLIHTEFTIGLSNVYSQSTSETRIGVGPGLAYFFTPNVSLEFLLLYRYSSSVYSAGASTQVNDFSHNFNPSVGFQIYFHKK